MSETTESRTSSFISRKRTSSDTNSTQPNRAKLYRANGDSGGNNSIVESMKNSSQEPEERAGMNTSSTQANRAKLSKPNGNSSGKIEVHKSRSIDLTERSDGVAAASSRDKGKQQSEMTQNTRMKGKRGARRKAQQKATRGTFQKGTGKAEGDVAVEKHSNGTAFHDATGVGNSGEDEGLNEEDNEEEDEEEDQEEDEESSAEHELQFEEGSEDEAKYEPQFDESEDEYEPQLGDDDETLLVGSTGVQCTPPGQAPTHTCFPPPTSQPSLQPQPKSHWFSPQPLLPSKPPPPQSTQPREAPNLSWFASSALPPETKSVKTSKNTEDKSDSMEISSDENIIHISSDNDEETDADKDTLIRRKQASSLSKNPSPRNKPPSEVILISSDSDEGEISSEPESECRSDGDEDFQLRPEARKNHSLTRSAAVALPVAEKIQGVRTLMDYYTSALEPFAFPPSEDRLLFSHIGTLRDYIIPAPKRRKIGAQGELHLSAVRKVCTVCGEEGHSDKTCGELRCRVCGAWDEHFTHACPKNKGKGERARDREGKAIWMQMTQAASGGVANKVSIDDLRRFCCRCSSKWHYGEECVFAVRTSAGEGAEGPWNVKWIAEQGWLDEDSLREDDARDKPIFQARPSLPLLPPSPPPPDSRQGHSQTGRAGDRHRNPGRNADATLRQQINVGTDRRTVPAARYDRNRRDRDVSNPPPPPLHPPPPPPPNLPMMARFALLPTAREVRNRARDEAWNEDRFLGADDRGRDRDYRERESERERGQRRSRSPAFTERRGQSISQVFANIGFGGRGRGGGRRRRR